MAYRPPSSSKWAPAEPFRRNKNGTSAPDQDGWQTVPSNSYTPAAPSNAKWGQSALKKPEPAAPKFEEQFPSLGGSSSTPSHKSTTTSNSKPMSYAELVRKRVEQEELERQQKAEEARRKTEEEEKNRYAMDFVPVSSFITTRTVAKDFGCHDYVDPENDTQYYNEYPHHHDHVNDHDNDNYQYDYQEYAEDVDDTY